MKEYERANPEGEGRLVSVRFVDGEFCFSPRRPPPKSGSFPCFRLSQRFRLFLGDSPRPPLCTSEWDRKKRARESAREAHHVATRRVTGGSERNSPPPPPSNGGPLSSPGASLSLSLASSQNSVSPGVQPLPRHPRPCWLFLSSTCRGSRPLALTAEARKSKSGKKPTVKPQNRVIFFFPSLCLLFPSSLSTASPRAPFTEPPPYPPPPP